MKILTTRMGKKAQITLPKQVREALGVKDEDDLIGFKMDGLRVTLIKADIVEEGESFTQEELDELVLLSHQKGGKAYRTGGALVRDLHKRIKAR